MLTADGAVVAGDAAMVATPRVDGAISVRRSERRVAVGVGDADRVDGVGAEEIGEGDEIDEGDEIGDLLAGETLGGDPGIGEMRGFGTLGVSCLGAIVHGAGVNVGSDPLCGEADSPNF